MLSFSWVISMKYFLVIVIFGLQFGGGMQMTFLCFGNMMNKSLGNSQKFLIPVVTPSSLLLLIVTNYSREKIGFLDVEVIKKGNQLVTAQPACTVLWTSPYGHISVETYWTIIGQKQDIQVLTLALQCLVCTWHQEIWKNTSLKTYFMDVLEDVPRTSRCKCNFGTFLGEFQDVSPKLKEYEITKFLVSNTHICSTKTGNITTEMRFVLMFKIDVLGTSRERHLPDVTFIRRHLCKTSLGSLSENLKP